MNRNPGVVRIFTLFVLAVSAACHGGSTPGQPVAAISAQPTDQSVVAGTTATFTVVARSAISYQWQVSIDSGSSFSNISGATTDGYTTAVTALADSGTQYRVVVIGVRNAVTSSAVSLTVTAAPVAPGISVHPADQTITAGQDASFSVTASGTSLSYQWQRSTNGGGSFADVAAATGATLNLTAVPLGNNGHQFHVVVSNGTGSITSNPATLTVNAPTAAPVFTTQPVSVSIIAGESTQFTVAVTGNPAPTLQWQLSTNSGGSWGDIVGETGATYSIAGAGLANNGRQYRAVAANSVNTVNSNVATLTVTSGAVAPAFTTQPANVTVTEGQNAEFSVVVTGTPTPSLQWQLSTDNSGTWNNINSATSATLTVSSATLTNDGWQYRAVASNSEGSVNSDPALLTVSAAQIDFGTAALIEAGGTSAARPQIAVASNGDAVAVWMQQSDGVYFSVWASSYTSATNSWGTAELIETGDGDAWDPQIVIDANGNALAVWYQDGDATEAVRYDIWANRYTAGSGWGTATLIETDDAGSAMNPQAALDGTGKGIAVWSQSDGTASHIRASRYTPGTGWGPATLIEAAAPGASSSPRIAFDTNNNAIAVWSRYDGTGTILSARYTAGSGWGTVDVIGAAGDQPRIAIDGSGNALSVWSQAGDIWSNRYTAGSGWGTAALIEWSAGAAGNPEIAMDTSGNALAVWQKNSGIGTNNRIWSNRYTVGSGWAGFPAIIQTDISGGGTANAEMPKIAMDGSGNAFAVWVQPDGSLDSTPDIWSNRYIVGTGWGTTADLGQVRINTPGTVGSAGAPQIAVNGNGNAMAVWHQSDDASPSISSIWSNGYH